MATLAESFALARRHQQAGARPSPHDGTSSVFDARWNDLGSPDAARAYRAIGALVSVPREAVALLESWLPPVPKVERKCLEQLLTNLGGKAFAARQRATRELEKLADLARPALEKLLAGGPPLETRRRAARLVDSLDGPVTSPELLRPLRAIEVLERIGSAPARGILRALAGGAPSHRITEDARAALRRLEKLSPNPLR